MYEFLGGKMGMLSDEEKNLVVRRGEGTSVCFAIFYESMKEIIIFTSKLTFKFSG